MNEAHADEVAAIEAMVGAYFEPVTADCSIAQLIANRLHGRSPAQVWLDEQTGMLWPAVLKSMRDLAFNGQIAWYSTSGPEKELSIQPVADVEIYRRAPEPQRVIGRPRKAAPRPGRKFSGMTEFSWRQR